MEAVNRSRPPEKVPRSARRATWCRSTRLRLILLQNQAFGKALTKSRTFRDPSLRQAAKWPSIESRYTLPLGSTIATRSSSLRPG